MLINQQERDELELALSCLVLSCLVPIMNIVCQ